MNPTFVIGYTVLYGSISFCKYGNKPIYGNYYTCKQGEQQVLRIKSDISPGCSDTII